MKKILRFSIPFITACLMPDMIFHIAEAYSLLLLDVD